MTTKETKDLIDAYKAALAAKDQTIQLLVDMVNAVPIQVDRAWGTHVPHDDTPEDWELAAEQAAARAALPTEERFVPGPHPLSIDDDAEDLAAAFEAGDIDAAQFEQALAGVQAFNTTIEIAR